MAYDFPNSPSVGQQVTIDSKRYEWTGTTWNVDYSEGPAGPAGATGPTGPVGATGPEASINAVSPLLFNSSTREISAPTVTTSAQAETIAAAAAAAAIAAHNADHTDVHGIPATYELETQVGAQDKATATADAKVLAHNNLTTNIHGIADTNALATEAEALSIATAEAAAQIETHRLDATNIHGISDSANLVYRSDGIIKTSSGATVSPYDIGSLSLDALYGYQHMSREHLDLAPRRFNSQVSLVSGVCWFHYFTPLVNKTISSILIVGGNPAAAAPTTIRFALYSVDANDSLTMVARTANQLSLFEFTNSYNTGTFVASDGYPATYNLVAGTRYAIGVIFVGSVPPGVYLAYNNPPVTLTSMAPRMTAAIGAQTDLPATVNYTTFSNTTIGLWARLI